MTDDSLTPAPSQSPSPTAPSDRIAKVMARAGVASRRDAERMILEGRVTVNGKKIDSPALDVLPSDRITVDGKTLDEPQETRLWLYYKPLGLVTTESDEKGRQTVFDALPRDLPRVMTIGRLDLTSEGLLLLTNDGELKRRLELPSTGWLRRYRVRVNGTPSDMTFAPLRRGATIEGEEFAPMEIKLDSQQGANAWLTVGIREGKNREIRRAMAHVGLQVNRLIRIGYGPFKLTGMEKNEVVEIKKRVLRDQLGGLLTGRETAPKDRDMRPRGAEGPRKPRRDDGDAPRRVFRADAEGGSRFARKPAGPRDDSDRPARPWSGKPRPGSDEGGDRPGFRGKRPQGNGDRPARPWSGKPGADRDAAGDRPRHGKPGAGGEGAKPAFQARGDRPEGERGFKPRGDGKPGERGFKPRGDGKPGGDRGFRPRGDAPRGEGKPGGDRKSFGKPGGPKPARGGAGGGQGARFTGKPQGRPDGKPGGGPRNKPRG
ncbi:pseudouridine synthase [Paracoccus sp. S3-43]|uniref:pseudouridine synthase n=1 Tax=Paracoccus sp. S3-43 TaxID=3030011 RepID=UPI0023AECF71|nr:pseudouridine synthase [Paracoccus sp. S3-43]WEF25301.1 pseudouridine synthase [Paracoccus sp. S3-43]